MIINTINTLIEFIREGQQLKNKEKKKLTATKTDEKKSVEYATLLRTR